MTEKRYQNKMRLVIDTEKNFGARVLTPEEIVELLNEKNEIIIELRKKHRELQIDFNESAGTIHDLKEKVLDLEDKIEELEKENERKQKFLDRIYDDYKAYYGMDISNAEWWG